jgi:DNA ligase-1
MKFKNLALYLDRLEKTSSRIEITKILAELFKKTSKQEIRETVYLLLGSLAPSFSGTVFNIAEKLMLSALSQAFDTNPAEVKALYKQKGDLGNVAQALFRQKQTRLSKNKDSDLNITAVYQKLLKVAEDQGEKSVERKIKGIADLLKAIDPLSARFLARIPVGRLRLGFSDKTVLDALSWLECGDKSAKKHLESAYEVLPDVGLLAEKVKMQGIKKASQNIKPEIGIPVMPMLAQRLKSPEDMIKKMSLVSVEPKFDGLRVLIHFKKGKFVKAFTRNLNDISAMFPELQTIGKYISAREAILDSEAIGIDPQTKKMVDFQITMQRRRKYNIQKLSVDIPLKFQVFDLLYINGKSLMDHPYSQRRERLEKLILKNDYFIVDQKLITDSPDVIRAEHKKMLSIGLEGVMVKKLDSKYVPGRTGWRWVKMKEVEEAAGKLSDTIDCVVMGYTRGRGKRANFGLGQFLAGVSDKGKFKTITKVGTGLTDEQLKELAKKLEGIRLKQKPKEYEVHKDLEPDFWVLPQVVIELAADEITKSPKHSAGLALRFPRLVRFRDDKGPDQSTTLKEIKQIYKLR